METEQDHLYPTMFFIFVSATECHNKLAVLKETQTDVNPRPTASYPVPLAMPWRALTYSLEISGPIPSKNAKILPVPLLEPVLVVFLKPLTCCATQINNLTFIF